MTFANRLRLYKNFFQSVMKLVDKKRHGAKVHKVYDTARTPYQRLLGAGMLTEAKRQELATIYHGLNPVTLLKQIANLCDPPMPAAVVPPAPSIKRCAQFHA